MGLTLLLLASLAAPAVPDTGPPIFALFSNVTSSVAHAYDLKDDQGSQMACVHAYAARSPAVWGGGHRYWALYQAKVGSEFQVRLASSSDLVTWAFRRTLLQNADMPYASRPGPATPAQLRAGAPQWPLRDGGASNDGWIVVTHEQWMRPGSTLPSQLGFKLYYNESQLLAGTHFNSYVAPLSVGSASRLEGTPSLYATTLVQRGGLWMVDADVGFHFNDERGIDQVASGTLGSFGPTAVTPALTRQARADAYDDLFASRGAVGNIGQRAPGTLLGAHLCAQEANVGAMPPTVWADWRVWLYFFGAAEGDVPTGASGNVTMLNVTTHGGSTAFGNPSWTVLPCPGASAGGPGGPSPSCLFVSYFLFGEGAAPGEAGVCAFVQQLPGDA
jgi:hypothetical protein